MSEEGLFVVRAESSEVTVSQGQDARIFGAIMGLTAEEYNDLERLEIAFDLSVLLKEYRPP